MSDRGSLHAVETQPGAVVNSLYGLSSMPLPATPTAELDLTDLNLEGLEWIFGAVFRQFCICGNSKNILELGDSVSQSLWVLPDESAPIDVNVVHQFQNSANPKSADLEAVPLDETEIVAQPQISANSGRGRRNLALRKAWRSFQISRTNGDKPQTKTRYSVWLLRTNISARRILRPVKGNNSYGRSGTLACAACRKRNSKVVFPGDLH